MNILKNKKFRVIVRPNAKKNEIAGFDEKENAVKVSIAAPAEKNKANRELVSFLSRILGRKVRISSGLSSKKKTIETE